MGRVKKRQVSDEEDPPSDESDVEPVPKKAKTKKKSKAKVPFEEEIIDPELWPQPDLLKLFQRMEKLLPDKDKRKFESAAEKLDWENIVFDNYSVDDCKKMWHKVSNRLRRYRLLKELLTDAKEWVEHPWTNFYRSQKTNRHPDMPKRPLSTYMMFYMDKKDRVAQEHAGVEMTELSRIIAMMYKTLPEKQKQKYVDKATKEREVYKEKMDTFYENHPDMRPTKNKRQKSAKELPGPKKPKTPMQHYLKEKMERHKNDDEIKKHEMNDHYKEAWKELPEKKRVNWIKVALEDEDRYVQELNIYKQEHPNYEGTLARSIINKEEKMLYDKSVGKPEKPPNSGYSLFSRIMLSSEEIKHINHKDRMAQISSMWKNLSPKDKKKYQDKVKQLLEKYKLDFATYLESLTPEKREEELQNNNARRRNVETLSGKKKKVPEKVVAASKSKDFYSDDASEKKKESALKSTRGGRGVELFKGEPEAPPSSPLNLFIKDFLVTAKHIPADTRAAEAQVYWNKMSETDRLKWRKRLQDQKSKYISLYESFLKSLTQEQLKEYSILKAKNSAKMEEAEESENSDEDNEDAGDGSSGSDTDDSSSGSDSDSDNSSSSENESD